ncbi:hypothetical protein [Novosphingobium lentum]|uniref:hypothetical protein n=1 Tax=Novosphingobium lentum TaxID=145287 RepID=UPI00082BF43E|nr:hypothetical protein [Novosphingobium lentum]
MVGHSPLDDPATAAYAWARYRRLMKWMTLVTLVTVMIVALLMYRVVGFVSIHFYIATVLGIGAAMLLTAALMGLVFLSSGTGHDESIENPLEDEREGFGP